MTFRGYHEVAGADGSGLPEQIARQHARVAERLALVERVVVVLSGKGGVGKSWVTAALALALARRGLAVGVVDADLHGPTVARLLGGTGGGPLAVRDGGVRPAVGRAGIRLISTDLLLDDGKALRWTASAGAAHAWRGAAEASMLREFFSDVEWGALDALLVDMPPDESRIGDVAALARGDGRDGLAARPIVAGIAVTIPSEESARSVARALDAAREARLPLLGVVENMSGYACGRCGAVGPLFTGDAGARLARAHGIPLLARPPFTTAPLDDVAPTLAPVVEAVLRLADSNPELPGRP